jgi:hypothetical protein
MKLVRYVYVFVLPRRQESCLPRVYDYTKLRVYAASCMAWGRTPVIASEPRRSSGERSPMMIRGQGRWLEMSIKLTGIPFVLTTLLDLQSS